MSDDHSTDSFRESFLKLNANLDFIAAQFADVIRALMRAAASDHPSSEAYRAAEKMNLVAGLLSRSEQPISFYNLFREALTEFDNASDDSMTVEGASVYAARRGIKYFVEKSCHDSAAQGRASRRRGEFMSAINSIDEIRRYNREKHGL